uniref:CUB domain-containing protein n=1 Tax=Xenopsylla cheopis TaxID=163159 RepID=A0A6M2E446_XENCH
MVLLLNAVLVVAGLIVVGAAEENQQDKSWESDIIKGLPNCTTCTDSTRLSGTIIFPEDDTKPYPTGCKCIWEDHVEEGYGIDITIENVTLNGQNEDVLYIRGGTQNDVQGKGMIFTWEIKDKKFTIKNSNKLMVMFVSPKKDDKHKYTGFKLRYQRHGEITTTPEPTTTAQPLPTSAPGGARPELVVYLKGITPANFNKNLKNFTEPLAKYAESFCKDKNITTVNPLTDKNVVINAIQYCPRYWPQQENCVDVRFSIPVELKEQVKNANATYQLSKWNLQRLWKGFAKTELQKLNVKEYESPDDAYYLSLWMGVTVGTLAIVLLAFLAIMYWIWRTSITKDYSRYSSPYFNKA